jgi:hypothetical protein
MKREWKPEWLSERSIKKLSLKRNEETELKHTLNYFAHKIELLLPKSIKAIDMQNISSTCEDFAKIYAALEQYEKEDPDELAIISTAQEFNQKQCTVQLCSLAKDIELAASMFDVGKRWEVWSLVVSISSSLTQLQPDISREIAIKDNATKAGKAKKGHKSALHLAIEMIIQEHKLEKFVEFEKLINDVDFLGDFSERLDPPSPCKLFEYQNDELHYMDRKGNEKTVKKNTLRNIFTKYKKTMK